MTLTCRVNRDWRYRDHHGIGTCRGLVVVKLFPLWSQGLGLFSRRGGGRLGRKGREALTGYLAGAWRDRDPGIRTVTERSLFAVKTGCHCPVASLEYVQRRLVHGDVLHFTWNGRPTS